MKLSFTTLGCPDWSLEQIAKNAKAFGYDGIELRTNKDNNHFSPDATVEEARRTGQFFRDAGVPVMSIMGYSTFAHVDDAKVAENQALLNKLVVLAEAMGAKYVRTFAGMIPAGADREAMTQRVANAIKPVAAEAVKRKVVIGLETHDDWCSGDRVLKVVKIVDSKGFGVVYDILNAYHSGLEAWDVTYEKVKPHICYCHLKDGYHGPDNKFCYVMLGAGSLPVREIFQRFRKDGFDSYFSFEWEKKWKPELEIPERVFPQFAYKVRALWDSLGN